ncbi:ExbD/TolR family protein [Salinarimonas chemoclinalis]|uniref:ExbD/TolR family protein n=1 Tax=Salinarimonas chemoclinalis TaxID=3241599 RepID=UPI00355915B0
MFSHGGPGTGGGGRRRRRGRTRAINEINMTPFIDVMLVLLIVFMVSAPLLSAGVPLDLPQASAGQLDVDARPVALSIDAEGRVYLEEVALADDEIASAIAARIEDGAAPRVFVRGDRSVEYGRVAQIMALVTEAGFERVALVTLPDGP